MAIRQGGKYYVQVLLDVHRFNLLEDIAMRDKKKLSRLAREIIYEGLQTRVSGSKYRAAEAADKAMWAESVRRRVEGRAQGKTHETQLEGA